MKKLLIILLLLPLWGIGQIIESNAQLNLNGNPITLKNCPYGSYLDTTTQTIGASGVTLGRAIRFNITDAENGITLGANDSVFTVADVGKYLITFSGIWQGTATKMVDVWLKVGGSNYANSNMIWKFVGTSTQRIVTVTYIVSLTAGQTFELWWWSDDAGTNMPYTTHQHTPDRPVTPSIIMTVNKISE
jgi:hypothetical protein